MFKKSVTLNIVLLSLSLLIVIVPLFAAISFIKPCEAHSNQDLIQLINNERQERGIHSLKENEYLELAAKFKAINMMRDQYWSHYNPINKEKTPWHFFEAVNYNYLYAGENLAKNFKDNCQVVVAFMNSEGHRQNVLNKNYKEIGVSKIKGELNGVETEIIVVLFGSK